MCDLVKDIDPEEWHKLGSKEKAVCALAPLWSLAALTDELPDETSAVEVARILKALVDRATVVLDVPNMGPLANIPEVRA